MCHPGTSCKLNRHVMQILHKIYLLRLATIATVIFSLTISCNRSSDSNFTVMKGEFVQSVTESGELEAIRASSIFMPRINYRYGYNFKIVGIVDYGTVVEKGDSVVALDPSSIHKYILQQEEALENARVKAEKQKVEAVIKRRDLEVQLKNEEASYSLKQLELERMQFESEMKKKVKELEFNKASLRLEKVRKKLELYPLLEKYDRQINELEVMQRQADIQNALEVLQSMVLYSPGNGYFIPKYNRQGGHDYMLGDDVYLGSGIASIPDVSEMKARSFINETDISKVKEGMKVVIRLDALPDITFNASVKEISKMCTQQERQKIFNTVVTILDNDPRLKPGMSVSCEYICNEFENELFVPNNCLFTENGKTYLFLKKGKRVIKKAVETGISNANHTIIHTNIKPGRELLSPQQGTNI